MSWSRITIGKGRAGNSAISVFDIPGDNKENPKRRASISQNKVSYWVSDCIFDIGITIFKDTEEGSRIQQMLTHRVHIDEITDYIDEIVFRNLSFKRIKEGIEQLVEKAVLEGRKQKRAEIVAVLFEDDAI